MNLFFKDAYEDYDIEDFLLLYTMLNGMVLPWLWFGNNTRLLLDWDRRTGTNMQRPLTRQSSYSTVH